MRGRLFLVFFAAIAAFVLVTFGGIGMAAAAQLSKAHADVAKPDTYAARYGAPMCDDRAASAYAAEPTPPIVESGEVSTDHAADRATSVDCHDKGSVSLRADAASSHHGDDLQRPLPTARDAAVVPDVLPIPCVISDTVLSYVPAEGGPRDGFVRNDQPPPRPIPW